MPVRSSVKARWYGAEKKLSALQETHSCFRKRCSEHRKVSMPSLGSIDNVKHYNYNILKVTFTRKTVVRKLISNHYWQILYRHKMITKNVALPYHLIHVIPVNQKPRHCFKGYTQVSEIITTEKNIFLANLQTQWLNSTFMCTVFCTNKSLSFDL